MARSWRSIAAAVAVVLVLCGCIGTTDRSEFDSEVRARGGGLTSSFVTDALDAIAAESGAGTWRDLQVLSLTATPARRTVTATVRDPDARDFVDTITVVEDEVVASTPVRDADQMPLEQLVVNLRAVEIDRVEEIAATALAEFGEPNGYVQTVALRRVLGEVRIDIALVSDRRTATASFDASGTFLRIER